MFCIPHRSCPFRHRHFKRDKDKETLRLKPQEEVKPNLLIFNKRTHRKATKPKWTTSKFRHKDAKTDVRFPKRRKVLRKPGKNSPAPAPAPSKLKNIPRRAEGSSKAIRGRKGAGRRRYDRVARHDPSIIDRTSLNLTIRESGISTTARQASQQKIIYFWLMKFFTVSFLYLDSSRCWGYALSGGECRCPGCTAESLTTPKLLSRKKPATGGDIPSYDEPPFRRQVMKTDMPQAD